MDKQIQQLAEMALGTRKQIPPVWQFYDKELEAFAELIARVCIAKCDDLNSMKYIANHFNLKIKGLNSE